MKERISTDVVVVGGGIVGASAALFLRRLGVAVVLLERDLCGSRSSGVNYGGVRRQGRPIVQLPLSQRAHTIWAQLPELVGVDGEYLRTGHLKIARSEADMTALERYRDSARDFDLGLQLVSGRALHERCPWLGEAAMGGSLCPEDGQANPRLVSPAFAHAARRLGADIREGTRVDEVEHDGSRFVTRCGVALEVRSQYLLNCGGAWAGAIAAQFGEPVPMQSGHPQMAVTEPLPFFMDVSLGVEGGGVYARQIARGNCIFGGGRGYALDELRARTSSGELSHLMQQAVALVPRLRKACVIRSWSGTEGYLPDRLPVIGPGHAQPALLHAFGFAGGGFQVGPAVGAVLADLVRYGRTDTPISDFSISRFFPGNATTSVERAHSATASTQETP